jgi:hypothetical protein
VEILAVDQPPPMPDVLQDAYLDRPGVKDEDGGKLIRLVGWLIGNLVRPVAVEISYRNRVFAVAPIDRRRPDVEATHPALGETPCGFSRLVDVGELAPEFELTLRALLDDGSRVAIGSVRGRHAELGADTSAPTPSERDETAAAQAALTRAVERLIERDRPPEAIDTDLLDTLAVAGRSVLVVGSGLGALARELRARGAALVDVLEPDARLAKVERVLTAHLDVARVFVHDGDPADPTTFPPGHALALARAEVPTDALRAHFPHHQAIASTGAASAWVVLAATEEGLAGFLRPAGAVSG